MLTILGGTYRELCLVPAWDRLYGSGLRAAAALEGIVKSISLFTYASEAEHKALKAYTKGLDIAIFITKRDGPIEWQYDHSGSSPRLLGEKSDLLVRDPIVLQDSHEGARRDNVLAYSYIESTQCPSFKAVRAVYDPQAGRRARPLPRPKCDVKELGIVLNLTEARAFVSSYDIKSVTKKGPKELAQIILKHEDAKVVVVKNGIFGAHVATRQYGARHVAAYKSDKYFGIGSGDIFSAVFASCWMEYQYSPFEAAEIASGATAFFCHHGGVVPLPKNVDSLNENFVPIDLGRIKASGEQKLTGVKPVYLAAPFFTLAQKWLIGQVVDSLEGYGLSVWSPSAEAGILSADSSLDDVQRTVAQDLKGLSSCGSLIAVVDQMDPGTIFEAGYALKSGLPITVYAENVRSSDLTMFAGTNCFITDDFASAIAHAVTIAYKL